MPNSRGMVCKTRRRTYVRIEWGLALVEHAIDVPQHAVRQDTRLQIAELVADRHRVVENRQPDHPPLLVGDGLNFLIRRLFGLEIRVRDDVIEQLIDARLLWRRRLLLLDEPFMRFAARSPEVLPVRRARRHTALQAEQNRDRKSTRLNSSH